MTTDSVAVQAFANRLRALMQAKGLTSERSRSGVDVTALAKGAGVSYEMARRYAEGLAWPRPDALAAIAGWLEVDASALAYGQTPGSPDPVLLEQCVKAVTSAQHLAGVTLTPEQAARVVCQLYTEGAKGQQPSSSSLAAMLKAMFQPLKRG